MFVKLFTQILDSSIADDRRLRHFFTDLLLCADPKGYVSMTDSAIARRIGASMDEVTWGLDQLSSPDPRSKTLDFEGRRIERLEGTGYGWRIINFENYKAMKSADDMREKTKERVRKFRESKRTQGKSHDVTLGNAVVTLCNASNPMQRQMQMQRQIKKKEDPPTPQGGALFFDQEIPTSEKPSNEILPDGWNRISKAEQGRKKVLRNTPIMIRIGKFFGQRESTLWTIADYIALQDVQPSDEDLDLIESHYSLELENNGYRITCIQTLLNQWPKARSKAAIYFSENPTHR